MRFYEHFWASWLSSYLAPANEVCEMEGVPGPVGECLVPGEGCLVPGWLPGPGGRGMPGPRGVPSPMGGAWSHGGCLVPLGCLVLGGAWWRPPIWLLVRAVRILLECILVHLKIYLNISEPSHIKLMFRICNRQSRRITQLLPS